MVKRASKIPVVCYNKEGSAVKEYASYGEVDIAGVSESTLRRRVVDGKEYLGFTWREKGAEAVVPQAAVAQGTTTSDSVIETLKDKEGKVVEIHIRLTDCFVNATIVC